MGTTAIEEGQNIVLRGSTETVCEFFECALGSVLYQRGVYPEDNFEAVKKYGIRVMVVKDVKLKSYLKDVMRRILCVVGNGDTAKSSAGDNECGDERSGRKVGI